MLLGVGNHAVFSAPRLTAATMMAAAALALAPMPVSAADLLNKNAQIVDPVAETTQPGAFVIGGDRIN